MENTQIGARHFGHCMTAQQQVAPVLWNLMRRAVDVSGHIGVGRDASLRQRPLKAAVRACRDYLEAASQASRSAAL